jgi:hypothetical protein
MKQTALNLLGCSSFSAIVLIGHAAQAEIVSPDNSVSASPIYAGYVAAPEAQASLDASVSQSGCSCQDALMNADSDEVGELAIDQLGCDCAGCRNTVMRMAQARSQVNP